MFGISSSSSRKKAFINSYLPHMSCTVFMVCEIKHLVLNREEERGKKENSKLTASSGRADIIKNKVDL